MRPREVAEQALEAGLSAESLASIDFANMTVIEVMKTSYSAGIMALVSRLEALSDAAGAQDVRKEELIGQIREAMHDDSSVSNDVEEYFRSKSSLMSYALCSATMEELEEIVKDVIGDEKEWHVPVEKTCTVYVVVKARTAKQALETAREMTFWELAEAIDSDEEDEEYDLGVTSESDIEEV